MARPHSRLAVGAEKSVGRAQDARELAACHRWERRAALAEELAVLELYRPDEARSGERSCVALGEAEQMARMQLELAAPRRKPVEALRLSAPERRMKLGLPEAELPDVKAEA